MVTFEQFEAGLSNVTCVFLFCRYKKQIDLMTLTLECDLVLKSFNLGHNVWTISGRPSIIHMTVFLITRPFREYKIFYLVTLTQEFGLVLKKKLDMLPLFMTLWSLYCKRSYHE